MHTVIFGGTGGIGQALIDSALASGHHVSATTTKVLTALPMREKLTWYQLDAQDETQIQQFCQTVGQVDRVINTIGLLHDANKNIYPEKSLKNIQPDKFLQVMQTNIIPTLLIAKHIKNNFKNTPQGVFTTISARVGSISDNATGGWYAYRASKAALNMCLKNISLEWRLSLKNVCVAALHPGTTDTALSKPFQKNVPIHKLFSPAQTAQYLWQVIDNLQPEDTGKFWAWDGQEIQW